MGWKEWKQRQQKLMGSSITILRESFYILTLSLLSLLLPLSFLLLARLSNAQDLLTFATYPTPPPPILFTLFLYFNPFLLYSLISFISITALLYGLTGRIVFLNRPTDPIQQPRLYTAWVFLCVLQVCVGLGIEGTIAAGVWRIDYGVGNGRTLLSRVVFMVGLHETMLHWSRTMVRPVVDDTVFGVAREERWAERLVMAASLGVLWWWRLREEIEALVYAVEIKKELLMGVSLSDFVGWWLYYVTVTIGMVRFVKGLLCLGKVLICRGRERSLSCPSEDDDKV